jgi:restriction system protein
MVNSIQESIGNPQAQVDWSRPDEWMLERLHGADREFAQKIWHSSRKKLNPRHTRGCWYFASKHGLLRRAEHDLLQITDRGRSFIEEVNGPVVAAIDEFEGLLTILQLVAEQGIARRSTLLPAYSEYSRSQTTFQSENVLKSSLYHRLRNLLDRKLITASGISYSISENGIAYLGNRSVVPSVRVPDEFTTHESSSELLRMADELRKEVREQLHSYLFEMDSFQFEKLIQLLLQEMGYENVYTTAPTNDKGVDVLGTIKMGISSVLEVIQVKRHRGSIGRPVLDQLRGSLHRFDAMRGTIITTGTFSKGAKDAAFERGAPPITLIDGATLLKLLLEHGIGVHKRQVEYIEFAPEKLLQFETDGD